MASNRSTKIAKSFILIVMVLLPIKIVSGNIEIFKRSTAKGGEKRATIFHEGPGDARKDEQAR